MEGKDELGALRAAMPWFAAALIDGRELERAAYLAGHLLQAIDVAHGTATLRERAAAYSACVDA